MNNRLNLWWMRQKSGSQCWATIMVPCHVDDSSAFATQWSYCSLALSHRYHRVAAIHQNIRCPIFKWISITSLKGYRDSSTSNSRQDATPYCSLSGLMHAVCVVPSQNSATHVEPRPQGLLLKLQGTFYIYIYIYCTEFILERITKYICIF